MSVNRRFRQMLAVPLHFPWQAALWLGSPATVQFVFGLPFAAGTR
jgi:hypothetical protein